MSVISIKNRLSRLEDERGIGALPFVVIHGDQSAEDAFAARGLRPHDPAHVIRVRYISATAA